MFKEVACRCGAEKTRDELRKQVCDAMAEEARSEEKLLSEDGHDITQVKKEVEAEAVVKAGESLPEEEEESNSPLAQEKVIRNQTVQDADEEEKDKEPDDGKKEESDLEEEQDKDEPEGSRSLSPGHWCWWFGL